MIIIKFFYEKLYTIYINIIFIQIIYVNNKKKKKKKKKKNEDINKCKLLMNKLFSNS